MSRMTGCLFTAPSIMLCPSVYHETLISCELHLERPILVGWSYGGFVICDYIRAYGQPNISGILFAGAATTLHMPTIMAEHVLKTCPTATASWYDDVGHAPFLEDPARFNRELAQLVHQVRF